jgi:hypothetical protein
MMRLRPGWRAAAAAVSFLALIGCAPDWEEVSPDLVEARSKRSTARTHVPSIPLPPKALLAAQPAPDCEAKPGAPAPRADAGAPAAAKSDAEAALALRIRLEYERECYRRAERRVRARLQQLQAATRETIKALGGADQAGQGQ